MKLILPASSAAAVERRIGALVEAQAARRIAEHDTTFWGGDEARAKSVANRLGWTDIATRMRRAAADIQAFAEAVRADGFADAVLLGMGGSSLAPEVLRQCVPAHPGYPRLHVLDTTDPATIGAVTASIDPVRTLFFVSSKSGSTIEVATLFAYLHALVEAAKPGRAGENFVAITDPDTQLQALAMKYDFRRVFTNPADIGGRYSALSYFGMVSAAVAGIDIVALLERGAAAETESRDDRSDGLALGALLGEMALAGRDKCTFIMAPEIAAFGLWAEQLIAESTGKSGTGVLPVDGEPHGTPRDYGPDRFFVQMRSESGANGEGDAVAAALVAEGFPVAMIDLDDAHDLGGEFARWTFAVAVAGQMLGINPFDEPNVQESKDNTSRVLRQFEETRTLDAAVAGASGVIALTPAGPVLGPLALAISELIDGAPEDGYIAITAYIEPSHEAAAAFATMRAAIRDATHRATTLGYGPRFLHSTGQLHKGGPLKGAFLQVTANEAADIAIPGRPFTFGQLKRAQAIGDFESLDGHGRPVLRVHLGDDIDGGLRVLTEAVRTAMEHHAAGG